MENEWINNPAAQAAIYMEMGAEHAREIDAKDREIASLKADVEMLTARLSEVEDSWDAVAAKDTEIESLKAEIKDVLATVYAPPAGTIPAGMPVPRMQLRWEQIDDHNAVCSYQFVFPLTKNDIRRKDGHDSGFGVVELGRTNMDVEMPAGYWSERLGSKAPYRDGAHAKWDSAHFGSPPIYVVAPDGTFALAK